MTEAISSFYTQDKNMYEELAVLDGSVDFNSDYEFISKNGIKKNIHSDAIEIILDLVKAGKIDPWNIDIVDLYDKYMKRIAELKQDNLRSIGKALLLASTLLRIKSDILQGVSISDFEVEPEDFFDGDDSFDDFEQMQIPTNNVVSFDEVLQRRTSVRLNPKRKVTLKELIKHIQFYEDLENKYRIKEALNRKEKRVRNYSKLRAEQIKELAHEEYVEEVVEKMKQNLNEILSHEDKIELRELCLLGFDKSSAFIALLFLEREEEFEVYQEEFYGNLYARKVQYNKNEVILNGN